jgi:aminoglycoside phosphotransferase (APT) family kinase protein
VVRLPSHDAYVAGLAKEDAFLPLLADHLSVPVPAPIATGAPSGEYPHPWSVRRWLEGETPDHDPRLDRAGLARDLGLFLRELRCVPAEAGPAAGRHSFYRGCHPSVYGDQVQAALSDLADQIDVEVCQAIWRNALRSTWSAAPVWFHGDVAVGNLLTVQGRLAAVIDFGTCGVGDPACDLVMAWTFFDGEERQIFRQAAGLAEDDWDRARGWALWKALVTLGDRTDPQYATQARALARLTQDPVDR